MEEGDVFLVVPIAAERSAWLCVRKIKGTSRVLHQIGHLLVRGVLVDLKGPFVPLRLRFSLGRVSGKAPRHGSIIPAWTTSRRRDQGGRDARVLGWAGDRVQLQGILGLSLSSRGLERVNRRGGHPVG